MHNHENILYKDETFYNLIKELDSLDFLSSAPSVRMHPFAKIYNVIGTQLAFQIATVYHTLESYEIEIVYYDLNLDGESIYIFSFENFFEKLPQDVKEKIIFHLDIFGKK